MFTPASLDALIQSENFKHLPTTLALEGGERQWEPLIEELRHKAAEVAIWESYQRIGLLFDTYGDAIDGVALAVEKERDSDGPYLGVYMTINGHMVSDGDVILDEQDMELIQQIDEGKLIEDTVSAVHNMLPNSMLGELKRLRAAFAEGIESGEQARGLASVHAPSVDAYVRKQLLAKVASDTPRVGGVGRSNKL